MSEPRILGKIAKSTLLAVALLSFIGAGVSARAESREVRIALQFGIAYLPLTVMKHYGLVQKRAQSAGLGKVKVSWTRFGNGAAMNDALISGNLDFGSGGVGPLLTIWDRTKGSINVKGVASLGSQPYYLNTSNPAVKAIKDFSAKDKIALPGIKVSVQAIILEMAAANAFGESNFAKLDSLTVSMKHPDAYAALISGSGAIDAHFANAPFQEEELQHPNIHRVLSSYDVLGGRHTANSIYTTASFHDHHPKIYSVVLAALKQATDMINHDRKRAAKVYAEETHSKMSVNALYKIISSPDFVFTIAPENIMEFATFMHKIGSLKHQPSSWKDVYFPEIHDQPGS